MPDKSSGKSEASSVGIDAGVASKQRAQSQTINPFAERGPGGVAGSTVPVIVGLAEMRQLQESQ